VKPARVYLFVALGALVWLPCLHYWIAPLSERLPADYSNSAALSEVDKFRNSPAGQWEANTWILAVWTKTLTSSGQIAIY